MKPYTRAIAALVVAGALVSQTPNVARAEEGGSNSHGSCHMSRNINGQKWSTDDCSEMSAQMQRDRENIHAMIARLFQPVASEKDGAQNQKQDQPANQGQSQDPSQNQGQDQGQSQNQNADGSGNPSGNQNPSSAKAKPQLSAQTMDAIAALIRHIVDRLWFWS